MARADLKTAVDPARSCVDRAGTMGGLMIERRERKPYWRHTKWQMIASLGPFLAVIIILPLYADALNSNKFLGFPLGYFLAAHGLVLIAVVTVASFVRQQDAIDHWHGAHEDN
jgi:putative solute:sodium symporter small subunit